MSDRRIFAVPESVLVRCRRLQNWDHAMTQRVLVAYRQFMELKVQHKDWSAKVLLPSDVVDLMWKQHILDVHNYVDSCKNYCQHIVGHNPDESLDRKARKKRIETTRISLTARFGDGNYNPTVWSFRNETGIVDDTSRDVTRRRARSPDPQIERNVRTQSVATDHAVDGRQRQRKSDRMPIKIWDLTDEDVPQH